MADLPTTSSNKVQAIDLERRIIHLCQQCPKGVQGTDLENELSNIDAAQLAKAINRLLSTEQITMFKKGNVLIYRLKDPEASKNVKGADNEEKLIYQIIEESGNKGIWIRDIRFKSNLVLTQVNKILKSLESKKLIKAIKAVGASKKKVYMVYNLEPDRSITGGSWYSDQDFESEFVEILNQQCYNFLRQKAANAKQTTLDPISQRNMTYASSREIWNYISQLGISKVQLSLEDIETILDTLIYDSKVEKSVLSDRSSTDGSGLVNVYRALEPLMKPSGLVRSPCSVCPLINSCKIGGVISPTNCQYLKDWLDAS